MKRRELSKQPHIPVYDYDNKFSYKHYLRDDKIPAFISTKQNQVMKKELDLEKADSIVIGANESKSSLPQQQMNKQYTFNQAQQQKTGLFRKPNTDIVGGGTVGINAKFMGATSNENSPKQA